MTEHFMRHGDSLTVVTIVNDPIYLAELIIRTSNWVLSLNQQINSFGACGPAGDEVSVPRGYVSHHLPGTNNQVKPFLDAHKAPAEGIAGRRRCPPIPGYIKRIQQTGTPRPTVALSTSPPVRRQPAATGDIETMKVQDNVYLLAGGGANIVAQIGEDGVLLVDSGNGPSSDKVIAAVKRVSDKPIRYIINTSADAGRIGGKSALESRRARRRRSPRHWQEKAPRFSRMKRCSGDERADRPAGARAEAAWPTDTYFTEGRDVTSTAKRWKCCTSRPRIPTATASIFFRRSDVVVAGDLFRQQSIRSIDAARGGGFGGLMDA